MRTKHKCLLSIEVFEFTGNDLGELRKQYDHDRYLSTILPVYTFNKEFGNIVDADAYLQFTDEGDEVFTLFNITTIDNLLSEEISGCGLDKIFENIDIRPYLNKMRKYKFKDFHRSISSAEYLIIEIEYFGGSSYWNADDFDVHFNLVGALVGNNLDIIEIL